MRVIYIGQYSEGTTSKMRADTLRDLLNPERFEVIDTNVPFYATGSLMRSIGFRYKRGVMINRVNKYIIARLQGPYDLIWVDKAVYLKKSTTQELRACTDRLVHFTPDPAFLFHKSQHFMDSLHYYDFAITTKSYELSHYHQVLDQEKVIHTTQGFDKNIHYPRVDYKHKKKGVVFIGHFEKDRGDMIRQLDKADIPTSVAGREWDAFIRREKDLLHACYLGRGIYGEEYPLTLSSYWFALGALSKWIPELHTTRTFEIPACGTVLLTESNPEIRQVFKDDEVVFYLDADELIEKVTYLMRDEEARKAIAEKGHRRVTEGGYDYASILKRVIAQIGL